MSVIEKTVALLSALSPADVQAMPPIERRRFADLLRHWAKLADKSATPKSGVLAQIASGAPRHE